MCPNLPDVRIDPTLPYKYSVNDAVRAEFGGVFQLAISGLQASTNFWVHLVILNKSSLAYQPYEDIMNFP